MAIFMKLQAVCSQYGLSVEQVQKLVNRGKLQTTYDGELVVEPIVIKHYSASPWLI